MSSNLYEASNILCAMEQPSYKLFKDRIDRIIKETGLKNVELAKLCKVTRQNVTEWRTGRSDSARMDIPFIIEDRLGYAARWVATGDGPVTVPKFDPADSHILEILPKISNPAFKKEISAFVEYQAKR